MPKNAYFTYLVTFLQFSKFLLFLGIIIILARTPEIGQGLGRSLSCGEKKKKKKEINKYLLSPFLQKCLNCKNA